MINFSRFEQQLPLKQLQKGRFYFEEELVCNLHEATPGYWRADVSGKSDYQVQVTIANDEITQTFCDCPHDVEFCKHVVAVLYEIGKAQGSPTSFDIGTFVSTLAEADLRSLVVAYSQEDPAFADKLRDLAAQSAFNG